MSIKTLSTQHVQKDNTMDFNKNKIHPNTIKWAQANDIEIEIGNRVVEIWHRCDSVNEGQSIMCHDMNDIDEALCALHDEFIKDVHTITLED